MTAIQIRILYLVFFFLKLGWELVLELLNMAHVRRNREQVPVSFQTTFTPELYGKSVRYTLSRGKFSLVANLFSAVFTLGLIFSGLLGRLDAAVTSLGLGLYTGGVIYIALIFIIFQIFDLPFVLYNLFVVEQKFGFNRMTGKLFALDFLKRLLISALLGIPVLYILFWFMNTTGAFWWIWAFGLFSLFQLLMLIIFPTLIAPLYNKFIPLEEGSLRDKIFALAEKLDFKTNGIFVMDGSRRSRHSNAYFVGLGKSKRIVLYDTLLAGMGEEEILAVLAHEIGHQKKGHIKKRLFISLATSLLVFYFLSLLLESGAFFSAFFFPAPEYHSLFVLLLFCAGPITFFFQPISSILSRRHEYQADEFAVRATGGPEGMRQALLSLGKGNLANLTPHPLYSFFYYSHPSLAERITAVEQVKL